MSLVGLSARTSGLLALSPQLRAPAPAVGQRGGVCRSCERPPSDERGESIGERLQRLLDTPVIDPTQEGSAEPELLRRFKRLVNTDYALAEALFAGGYFAVLLFLTQQGVRVYKHCYFSPDALCPWAAAAPDPLGLF